MTEHSCTGAILQHKNQLIINLQVLHTYTSLVANKDHFVVTNSFELIHYTYLHWAAYLAVQLLLFLERGLLFPQCCLCVLPLSNCFGLRKALRRKAPVVDTQLLSHTRHKWKCADGEAFWFILTYLIFPFSKPGEQTATSLCSSLEWKVVIHSD